MKLIKTKLGSYIFFYKKGDKTIGERISLRKYERFETYLMRNLAKGKDLAVDVGANIGYYTLVLSGICKKVIAFEPEPVNFILLKRNIHGNKIKNVRVFKRAVSDKAESLSMGISKDNLGDHQINSIEEGRKNISIKSATLDGTIKDYVSILKIDTQGWEPKVILGGRKIISRDLPIIFMEFWPEGYKRTSLNYMKMIKFLESKYGNILLIDDVLNLVYKVSPESLEKRCSSNKGYVDLLFVKEITWNHRWIFFKKFKFKNLIKKIFRFEMF